MSVRLYGSQWKMYCFKIGGHSFHSQSVKLVRIRIYSGPPFPEFGLDTERDGVSLRILSKCRKMRARITPNLEAFYAVSIWKGVSFFKSLKLRAYYFTKFTTSQLFVRVRVICHDNHIVLGDFNMDSSHTQLQVFMEHYNYCSLIKNNTCFKGRGSCIDSILTNRKYFFKNTSSFETGISDHHHLIHSMLKTKFEKVESKKVTYRNYKQFQWENVEKDLTNSLGNCNGEYENYEQNFMCLIHPPWKNTSWTSL